MKLKFFTLATLLGLASCVSAPVPIATNEKAIVIAKVNSSPVVSHSNIPVVSRSKTTGVRQCYTGKNGGTYTITATGKRNYAACGSSQQVRTATATPVRRSRPSASRTCYTGPRGGTYTITASGNKNYSGC